MRRVGCYQTSRGGGSVNLWQFSKVSQVGFCSGCDSRSVSRRLALFLSGLGNLLVKTWLQSMPFDFNSLYFHDNPFEQWCLNELCPSVAPWCFKEWRNGATPFISSEGFQVAVIAGLREQIKFYLLPDFLTKLQILHCLLSMTCLLPSGRRHTGDISHFSGWDRLFAILALCSSKACLLEALSADR